MKHLIYLKVLERISLKLIPDLNYHIKELKSKMMKQITVIKELEVKKMVWMKLKKKKKNR